MNPFAVILNVLRMTNDKKHQNKNNKLYHFSLTTNGFFLNFFSFDEKKEGINSPSNLVPTFFDLLLVLIFIKVEKI